MCPAETPEGQGCGLVLNKCMLTHVRCGVPQDQVVAALEHIIIDRHTVLDWVDNNALTLVVVNGDLWASTQEDGASLRMRLREARWRGSIPEDSSLAEVSPGVFSVSTDNGACTRACVRVDRLDRLLDASIFRPGEPITASHWNALFATTGAIEYLDSEEIEHHCRVCADLEDFRANVYTHMELHTGAALMSYTANMIPYSNHNQSPRVIYQAAMSKQAMAVEALGARERYDMHTYTLWYGQRAFSQTNVATITPSIPSTIEVVLMVGLYQGFGQEDAIIMKKSAVDRGLFAASTTRVYSDELNMRGNDDEIYCKPTSICAGYKGLDYSALESTGAPRVGSKVTENSVLIGKTSQTMQVGPDGRHVPLKFDRSIRAKEEGVVANVKWSISREGRTQIKVLVRTTRIPTEADKFASRHAQKGTTGLIVPDEDMPFTAEGITPDIIISPFAFITRMTMGMMIETVTGKAAAINGEHTVDASAFNQSDVVAHAQSILAREGFHPSGVERFTDGRTGEMIEAPIMVGSCSYQRLKHLVDEKIHSRTEGQRHILTQQPTEGRGRGGGLRIGEMERDVILSHGASAVIQDRFLDASDKCSVAICNKCGYMCDQQYSEDFAYGMTRGRAAYCRICEDGAHAVVVHIPAAMRLLMQELMSFGGVIKMRTRAPFSATVVPPVIAAAH